MLESIFPLSFKSDSPIKLIVTVVIYIFLPTFIGIVCGQASAIPYVSVVSTLLTVIVALYCAGGIIVSFLKYFRIVN